MTAIAMLANLRAREVTVEAHGDRLRLVPAERVTDAALAILSERKPELLRLLADINTLRADGTVDDWRRVYDALPARDRQRLAEEVAAGDPIGCILALCLDLPLTAVTADAAPRGAA